MENTVTVKDLQSALLDVLISIDEICNKYDISYSLASGTAIGAIRHKGFIPWDDDLDLMFLRDEYDKFLKIAPDEFEKRGLTLQKEYSKQWPMTYSKVRKNNTTYIENYKAKIKGAHQGIFVDIFPVDNLLDDECGARLQWLVFHILASKCLNRRGYTTKSMKKKAALLLSSVVPQSPLISICKAQKHGDSKRVHTFLGAAVHRERNIFPREAFSQHILVEFEGHLFPIISGYDEYLKISYGDYMRLPSMEDRKAHLHAEIIDLNHSYEEYLKVEGK